MDSHRVPGIQIDPFLVAQIAADIVSYLNEMASLYEDAELSTEKKGFDKFIENFILGRAGSDRIFYDVFTEAKPGSLTKNAVRFSFKGFTIHEDEVRQYLINMIYGADYEFPVEKACANAIHVWEAFVQQLQKEEKLRHVCRNLFKGNVNLEALRIFICQQAGYRLIGQDLVKEFSKVITDKMDDLSGSGKKEKNKHRILRNTTRIAQYEKEFDAAWAILHKMDTSNSSLRGHIAQITPVINESSSSLSSSSRGGSRIARVAASFFGNSAVSVGDAPRITTQLGVASGSSRETSTPSSKSSSRSGSRIVRKRMPEKNLRIPADPGDERASLRSPVAPPVSMLKR